MSGRPFVLGIGGTTRAGSSSELVLRAAMKAIEGLGAETEVLAGPDMVLPLYAPENPERDPKAQRLIDLVRRADGVAVPVGVGSVHRGAGTHSGEPESQCVAAAGTPVGRWTARAPVRG